MVLVEVELFLTFNAPVKYMFFRIELRAKKENNAQQQRLKYPPF